MLQKGQSCDHSAWLCWLSPKICLGGRNQDQELAGFWQGSGGVGRSQPIGQSVWGGLAHLWLFLTYPYLQEYSRSFQVLLLPLSVFLTCLHAIFLAFQSVHLPASWWQPLGSIAQAFVNGRLLLNPSPTLGKGYAGLSSYYVQPC